MERRDTWSAPGAGFLVHANGMRMLTSLGLGNGVKKGAVIRRWHFCDQQGDLLSQTDLEVLWGHTDPCVGIERPELQRALLAGVVDVRCRLGTSVTALAQDDARVWVGFSDGSTGHYDLVIGADGMKSTVRDLILGTGSPSELGAMTWRSISQVRSIPGPTAIQFHLGDGCLFGFMPIGRGCTYGFNYVITQRFRDSLEGRLERLRHRLRNFGPRVQEYLAALERDDQVICSTMMWMEIKEWHAGRVVLVGDAAHASSPMMGQGGCMDDGGCLRARRGIALGGYRGGRAGELCPSAQAPRRVGPAPEHGSGQPSHRVCGGPQWNVARARHSVDAGSFRTARATSLACAQSSASYQ